ncbi:hypothetical protein HG535_0A05950 [Zygotorulaspora mrakii]|uniref:Ribosome biogenesis protein NOP53 n=1 Tax=Zygotorulaspora mrakii TaxID=42260 RepID=A0A7H9AWP5_ZYGMR|nr:uncharacterized protein HG535_0A05950 [Zygotorulaspora mrakii]QLG70653.1 hypothetical protein HG535_0A05950 [Zygotorulaspora mrakii]
MVVENVTKRPAQHKQTSRKGKKAWRKNIDLTDIEKSIAEKKDQEITHGTSDLGDLNDTALFQIDETGDNDLKSKLIKRKQIKKNVKSREILDAIKTNSKIGALKHVKHDEGSKSKVQNVSKKELRKLLALAGKIDGESKANHRMAKDGLSKFKKVDLWGDDSNDKKKVVTPAGIKLDVKENVIIPEELLTKSTSGWSIASVKPDTLDMTPVKVKEIDEIPHAGKSYNPDKADWSDLINSEYEREKVIEDNKIAMKEYREKIKRLMEVLNDSEEEESSSEDDATIKNAEQDADEDNGDLIRLSVNEVVKNKKKTKYQRNRARRHEEKIKMHMQLRELKAKLLELEKLEEIEKEVKERLTSNNKSVIKDAKVNYKRNILQENFEAKLSDELSDSLRKLRPEGSLLRDQIRKLQSSGKIESRVKMRKSKKIRPKITEKWTHKDFK